MKKFKGKVRDFSGNAKKKIDTMQKNTEHKLDDVKAKVDNVKIKTEEKADNFKGKVDKTATAIKRKIG